MAASGLSGAGFVFAGFLPKPAARAAAEVRRLDACGLPVVAFESPRRLPATLAALAAAEPDRTPRCAASSRSCTSRSSAAGWPTSPSGSRPRRKGEVTLVLAAVPLRTGGDEDVPADALAELVARVRLPASRGACVAAHRGAAEPAVSGRYEALTTSLPESSTRQVVHTWRPWNSSRPPVRPQKTHAS